MKKVIIYIFIIISLSYLIISCTTDPESVTLNTSPTAPTYTIQTNKSIAAPKITYIGYNGTKVLVSFTNKAVDSRRRFVMDIKNDGTKVLSGHEFLGSIIYSNSGYYEVTKAAGSAYDVTAICRDSSGIGTSSTNNINGTAWSLPVSGNRIGSYKGRVKNVYTGNGVSGLYIFGVNSYTNYYYSTVSGAGGYFTLSGLATNGYGTGGDNITIYVFEKLSDGVYIPLAGITTRDIGGTEVIDSSANHIQVFPPQ